ncbi:hypothetical protein conserved [Leishmania donovani]|uniref:Hypothetical_protein_conserved n=1 Tax=Leishmania donovani TaxID=5661 RepID=A0A6J8FAV9_LEIDO|nr:hypothetical protein conserved [Leishmania donovani]VDZ44554.1 hypothetical_protein_conserved [Leishmania donovani]
MEEQLFQSDIVDLGLTTLEALVREQRLQNARMEARLRVLEKRMSSLPLHMGLRAPKKLTCSDGDDGGATRNTALSLDEVEAPGPNTSADDPATPMCDYCFLFSHKCFPCPCCGREWYCSAACQRLRHRCHASRCGQHYLPQTRLQPRVAH